MPIYSYRCEECHFTQDILQKMTDPVLTICPSCNEPRFKKQVTAAGFQLKGSGWYATDFKSGSNHASAANSETPKNDSSKSDSPENATKSAVTQSAANSTESTNASSSSTQ